MDTTKKQELNPVQRLWRLLKPDRHEITNVYIYAIFNGLINLSLPLGIQAIVNLIQVGQINVSWIVLVIIVVLGVALTGILQIFQLRIVENLQQKIFTRAAFEFAYRVPRIRMETLYRKYAPELMNRFFDIMSVQKGLSKILIDFSAAVLQIVFGLILLSLYHPFFILFSLVVILFVVLVFRFTAGAGLQTSLLESNHKFHVAYWLEELARTFSTFKLAGGTELPLKRTDERVRGYVDAREGHFRVLVRQHAMMIIFKVLVVTGLLAIGGILVMEQLMNIGQFVAAEIIIILIMSSVEKLVLSIETIYDVLTALEKIGQVTDLELENDEGIDLVMQSPGSGISVNLENVSYAYPGSTEKTIRNLSLSIGPGERLMITGVNGSGKSTLIQIIAGLHSVSEGTISYQGLPKDNLSALSLRSITGDCLSQEQLFEGSVITNITLDHPDIDFEYVKLITDKLGLSDFIRNLPKGFNTPLLPHGSNLPRSIVQLLLIARSVARKPKLLLLEYVFEHLDFDHRKRVIDFLTDKQHGWTFVAVSSDPYLALKADRIAVMNRGNIEAHGTYQEVKSKMPFTNNNDHA